MKFSRGVLLDAIAWGVLLGFLLAVYITDWPLHAIQIVIAAVIPWAAVRIFK